jgi:23S rRNA (cytosine1962-C5)-methyltransferase
MGASLPTVVLRKGRAKPLWHGHPWVFSQAIARVEGEAQDGALVRVADDEGREIGRAFFEASSLIRARIVARGEEPVDGAFFDRRLRACVELRRRALDLPREGTNGFRLVNSEGDFLPGLIVDVFGDALVVWCGTAGMRTRLEGIADALERIVAPRAIVLASEGPARVLRGTLGDAPQTVTENGFRYACDLLGGQKTGFYFDQRENRRLVESYARGRRVLDAYCYSGSFALHAARGGASRVLAVDASLPAAELADENARANGLEVEVIHDDAARALRRAREAGDRFDLVVLDPPKFAPRASATGEALRAYRALNAAALHVIDEGLLLTASCSHHVGESELVRAVAEAATDASRRVAVLEVRGQAPDHPWLAACPEGRYLTMLVCAVSRRPGDRDG